MTGCGRTGPDATCPISKTPCPGECIYSDILENIDIGILVLDVDEGTVVFQNQAAVDLLCPPLRPRDYEGIRLLFPGTPASPSRAGTARTLRLGSRLYGYTVYNVVSRYVWIFVRDITEKVRLESIAETVNMMDNIGTIFMGIRHEIGNPVNSIKMSLAVLRKNLLSFPRETVAEYVDRALAEILRVEYLLKALKSFSMFEKPVMETMDLDAFLSRFVSLVEGDFREKGIGIRTSLSGDARMVRADSRALHQVMLNLVTNASDALQGRAAPEILIRTVKGNGVVRLSVEDNGCGMSAEQRGNLFTPFHTTKEKGTGLGLVITRKLLTRMGGSIDADSREGQGTTFVVSLPEGLPPGEDREPPGSPPPSLSAAG